MTFAIIQFAVSADFVTFAPTLELEVEGVTIRSILVEDETGVSTGTYTFSFDFSGPLYPTSLILRFANDGLEIGRSITIDSVTINGADVTNEVNDLVLNEGENTTVDVMNIEEIFGQVAPDLLTYGPATYTGTGANDTFNGSKTLIVSDVMDGQGGVDTMRGYLGDDVILGGAGDDRIFGGAGDDILSGEADDDNIRGEDGNDTIFGGIGADRLFGGDDNDILFGGTGDDSLNGEAGDDVLLGEDGDDYIAAGTGDDIVNGGDGADQIIGQDGNDMLFGDAGQDYLNGSAGNDTLFGGDDADILVGDAGNDTLYGESGGDFLMGRTGSDTLYGGDGTDTIYDEEGDDTAYGDAGDDYITGGTGADTLNGGSDNDILYGNGAHHITIATLLSADPTLFYNQDTNSFYRYVAVNTTWATANTAATDATLNGVAGHLAVINSAQENTYLESLMNAGSSTWLSASGNGSGASWTWTTGTEAGIEFSVGAAASNNMYENWLAGEPNEGGASFARLVEGSGQWTDRPGTDTYHYFIEFDAAGMDDDNAADILNGDSGNDTLYGFGGNDTLNGGNDNDNLYGGAGADTIDGGSGNDLFTLSNGDFAAGESITGANGTDTIILVNATTVDFTIGTLATIETVIGSSGNDNVTLLATHVAGLLSTINLQGGTDILNTFATGNISADTIATITNTETGNLVGDGANNAITLTGTQLNTLLIGAGTVTLGAGATDTINLTSTSTDLNTLGATDASIQGLEILSYATAGAGITLTLTGQTEGFIITGSGSADTITGGAGADTVEGGAGNDTLNGNGGTDTLTYENATSAITVSLNTAAAQNTGGAGTDTLSNFENLIGSDYNDTLTGNGSSNIITGGDGNDTIFGGPQTRVVVTASSDFGSYGGGGQDIGGTITILDDDVGFSLDGNLWKGIFTTYTITANTVLEFDFRSTNRPEIAAIGFDTNNSYNDDNDHFFLYGDQTTGISYSAPTGTFQYDGSGNWQHIQINVGTYFTGTYNNLHFINDDDGAGDDGDSFWRNIVIHEGNGGANILNGGDGDDQLYGAGGLDTFVFDNTNDMEIIHYFNTQDGDRLDISGIVTGFSGTITDYVQFTNVGDHVRMAVDTNGLTGGTSFTTIAEIRGAADFNAATLYGNGQIIV